MTANDISFESKKRRFNLFFVFLVFFSFNLSSFFYRSLPDNQNDGSKRNGLQTIERECCYSCCYIFSFFLIFYDEDYQKECLWLSLLSLSANSSRQLNIFGHDGDSFGVNRTQVGILE